MPTATNAVAEGSGTGGVYWPYVRPDVPVIVTASGEMLPAPVIQTR
jgi:hypothetical protein